MIHLQKDVVLVQKHRGAVNVVQSGPGRFRLRVGSKESSAGLEGRNEIHAKGKMFVQRCSLPI